jgi:hypothetical protein
MTRESGSAHVDGTGRMSAVAGDGQACSLVGNVQREIAVLSGAGVSHPTKHIEEIACSAMHYGRLRHHGQSQDIGYRVRETPWTITAALFVLERQGRAKQTKDRGRWELQI